MRLFPGVLVAGALFACADTDSAPEAELPYETLSEYGFFEGPLAEFTPAEGVISYVPASPLWADHARKGRYIVLPGGAQVVPTGDEDWEFPLGTIVVKNFYYVLDRRDPDGTTRVMETRLLIREEVDEGWTAHTYVWNDEQTEAERVIAGRRLTLNAVDESGVGSEIVYLVPNTNQCRDCHGRDDVTVLLGVNTYQLDFETGSGNQLNELVDAGLFSEPPQRSVDALVDPADEMASLDDRARSYLHANCSHCHRTGGDGGRSGLDLTSWQEELARFGVCKTPVAAGTGAGGRSYDIVPGHPDESILLFRMASVDPEIRMPELPSRLPDELGVSLVEEWIEAMDGDGCP